MSDTPDDKNKLPEAPPPLRDDEKQTSILDNIEKVLEDNVEVTDSTVGVKIPF
jgi:hypothetical protein